MTVFLGKGLPEPDLGIFNRDVSTGAIGAIEVAPKFSDTLTLSPPGVGIDYAHPRRGRY